MAFDTQITDLVGGTIDQTACDQWAADACKEIIHVLPAKLKAKCATKVSPDTVASVLSASYPANACISSENDQAINYCSSCLQWNLPLLFD